MDLPEIPIERIIKIEEISLAQFAWKQTKHSIFEQYIFEDCLITGPGLLWPIGRTRLTTPWFEPYHREGLFWPVGPERQNYIGAVQALDCRFENCRFEGIGLIVAREDISRWIAIIESSMGLA